MLWPAMATLLVVKTGLCVASGMTAASFFSAGALVSAAGALVLGAAHRLVASAKGRIQESFFMSILSFCLGKNALSAHWTQAMCRVGGILASTAIHFEIANAASSNGVIRRERKIFTATELDGGDALWAFFSAMKSGGSIRF